MRPPVGRLYLGRECREGIKHMTSEPTNAVIEPDVPGRSRSRWWKWLLLGLFALVVLSVLWVAILFSLAGRAWREAVAEADRLDPGWRFEELAARRPPIPDEQNAALHVLAAADLLPDPWPPAQTGLPAADPFPDTLLRACGPERRLDANDLTPLTVAVESAHPALDRARTLKTLPSGRYPTLHTPIGLPDASAHAHRLRRVSALLAHDVLVLTEAGDTDAALGSCRALLNAARSVGDDPDFPFHILRLELRPRVCRLLERTLAQGQAPAAELEAMQRLLEDEEREPVFLHGARGFRAWMDRTLEILQAGNIPVPGVGRPGAIGIATTGRPAMLRASTRLVEVAKLPVEEQAQALAERLPREEDMPLLAGIYLFPKLQKATRDLSTCQLRSVAELRCATVALAAERYRQARGAWPESPAALVPEFLPAVPVDPFDGQPLRWRRTADGVVVYCLGPDGIDDGGAIDAAKPNGPGTDLGFRLWDVPNRRRPPLNSPRE